MHVYILDIKWVLYKELAIGPCPKNKQNLKNWLKQNEVSCYRVYDADIPEYNVAVDVYDDSAVIFEYAAPKEIDDNTAQKRLQDVISLTAEQLKIAPENIAVPPYSFLNDTTIKIG